jgi:hypothetical protein
MKLDTINDVHRTVRTGPRREHFGSVGDGLIDCTTRGVFRNRLLMDDTPHGCLILWNGVRGLDGGTCGSNNAEKRTSV